MLELSIFSNWWNKFLWAGNTPIHPIEEEQLQIKEQEKQEMESYFTVEELCASQTASNLHINNTPSYTIKQNIERLIRFLNPLRKAWGSPIRISSGYRCRELNKIVGGVSNSAHLTGNAVDMIPINGKQKEFEKFIVDYLTTNNLKWDQALIEQSKTSKWVHLGLYDNIGRQRCEIKNIIV